MSWLTGTTDEMLMRARYGDKEKLENEWVSLRKRADKADKGEGGEDNKQALRLRFEANQARMAYDLSFMLEKIEMLEQQLLMLSHLGQRIPILEGAYAHCMMVANGAMPPPIISKGARQKAE